MLNYPLYFCLNTNKPHALNIIISPINIELKYNIVPKQSFDYDIVHIIVIKEYLEIIRLRDKRELHIHMYLNKT